MDHTADNTSLLSCGAAFLPLGPAKISPDLQAIFIVRTVVNVLTCPLIALLNILVIVAVKTKRELRTKSNVALACLATTDLVVGLVVQPLQITRYSLLLHGETELFCSLRNIVTGITVKCVFASLYHLLLISAERYLAINHPFTYEDQVTKVRIIIASGLVWAVMIILPAQDLFSTNSQFVTLTVRSVLLFLFFFAVIYFNIAVYIEARRNEKQIAANQVSLEAKEKFLKKRKAFYTTTIVLLAIFLCYLPTSICVVIIFVLKDRISANVGHIVIYLVSLLPVLNAFINPLIYAVRIRSLRVAFIQLLSRKTLAKAEELERKIFGPRQVGVTGNVELGQDKADQHENE